MRTFLIVLIFLLLGAFFIVSNNSLHLNNKVELHKLGSAYYSWLGSLFGNFKSLTSYVVKSSWLPETSINASSNSS